MTIASSPVYVDTSALAKLYVREVDSDALEVLLVDRTDLLVSDLAVTELTSALVRKVREGQLDGRVAGAIYQELLRDITEGQFQLLQLDSDLHRQTEQLLLTLGSHQPLRAADALHLATALAAGARALVTFDQQMRVAAQAVGALEVVDL